MTSAGNIRFGIDQRTFVKVKNMILTNNTGSNPVIATNHSNHKIKMSKLVYKTKAPKKGYVGHQSLSTHEPTTRREYNYPEREISIKAMRIVDQKIKELLKELIPLGYDETKARFLIHFKDK